jgi:hypothetical protein
MSSPPAPPLYRITPLTPTTSDTWYGHQPIEVPRPHVPAVCFALRRSGVRYVRLQPARHTQLLLDMLAARNLPFLMRRQAS